MRNPCAKAQGSLECSTDKWRMVFLVLHRFEAERNQNCQLGGLAWDSESRNSKTAHNRHE